MPANSKSKTRRPAKSSTNLPLIPPDWVQRYEVAIDDSQQVLAVAPQRIRDVVRSVLGAERCASAVISLAIVNNRAIHELNVRFLQHDYPTDVLSFLLESELDPASLPVPKGAPRGQGKRLEGDIVVSAEMAQQSAAEYGWQPIDELTLYVVHGLLHLCGYDDRTSQERSCMRQRERHVLADWGLTPHYPATT